MMSGNLFKALIVFFDERMEVSMAYHETTSRRIATLASTVLSGTVRPTQRLVKTLAAAVLTQAPDKDMEPKPERKHIRRKAATKH